MSETDSKIEIESITSPQRTDRVDRVKYMAMREALMPVLPNTAPGITVAEAKAALLEHLSEDVFPGGAKAGWWLKAVQLDLEAKGLIARGSTKPVRLYRCEA
ncbi:DUF6958 family protein [Roseobacter sp. CCS2]|uniref:DUF6958 family protein n=1 Tax=Roseobacter sp. CCS2 TaxID=391593 RepID=UPI0000F3F57D|nr:hypothetical protein [Roseobacter sp. CCS2]EBA10785.1 hypothetical protein RCCS2_11282 [Roseobacter sp. CCS2]